MKKFSFFVVLFLCYFNLFAVDYQQGFNGSAPDWTISGCPFNSLFQEGTHSLEFNGSGDFAISPAFASGGTLSFFGRRSGNTAPWVLKIQISINNGVFTDIGNISEINALDNNSWSYSYALDISSYSNFRIKLIDERTSGGHSRYIDAFKITNATPLPVELVDFKVNKNRLSFVTATEKNNAHFVIERSSDAKNFVEIGRLKGAGTSSSYRIYEFIDQEQLVGSNYYRLKQVDNDGRFEHSKIIVSYLNKKNIKANIISMDNNSIRLSVISDENTDAKVSIVDMNGRIITIQDMLLDKNTETDFYLGQNLQKGMYAVSIVTANNQITSKLFYIN